MTHWASDRVTTLLVRPDGYAALASETAGTEPVTARLAADAAVVSWTPATRPSIPRDGRRV